MWPSFSSRVGLELLAAAGPRTPPAGPGARWSSCLPVRWPPNEAPPEVVARAGLSAKVTVDVRGPGRPVAPMR